MATIESALGLLKIEQASPDELSVVMEILDQAAAWLLAKGVKQWDSPPPPEFWRFMEQEIEKGAVYLARREVDDLPIATFRFAWSDKPLWADESACAGYVYTLATRISVHGHGIGATLLDWAKEHVKSRKRNYLRLDCLAANPVLCRYYERLGFRYCGQATSGAYTMALYEMELS